MPAMISYPLPVMVLAEMWGVSWRPGGARLEELALLRIQHRDFTGNEQLGELVVHRDLAVEVVDIFAELYDAGFPIAKMRRIDHYNADDHESMMDNNTSAFCTRLRVGKSQLSKHSFGLAIDINPIQNPYFKNGLVLPTGAERYLDRSLGERGMIVKGSSCHEIFTAYGWTWGGDWQQLKDYQHFEKENF